MQGAPYCPPLATEEKPVPIGMKDLSEEIKNVAEDGLLSYTTSATMPGEWTTARVRELEAAVASCSSSIELLCKQIEHLQRVKLDYEKALEAWKRVATCASS